MAAKIIQIVSAIGFIMSLYAVYVKTKSKSKRYKPMCDLNESISCTKAFNSEYGSLAFLPNSLFGMVFYSVVFVLAIYGRIEAVFYLALAAAAGSVYLAYINYVRLRNFCLVCTAIYIVNFLLLGLSF